MPTLSTNTHACIGAGICASTSPNVFDLDENGLVVLKAVEVDAADLDATDSAIAVCPAQALSWASRD